MEFGLMVIMEVKKKELPKKNIQKELLKKLEQYGESLMDDDDYRKRKKKAGKKYKKTNSEPVHTSEENSHLLNGQAVSECHLQTGTNNVHKRTKKKKRKKKGVSDTSGSCELEGQKELSGSPELTGERKQLQRMKEELGLMGFKSGEKIVEGKGRKKGESKTEAEVVIFSDRRKKKEKGEQEDSSQDSDKADKSSDGPEFSMRQARFEVQKFGIKGFEGGQKEEAMTALLIKLGAKPPKRKFYNYKQFQEMRKKEIEEEKEKRETMRSLGYKVVNPAKSRKRPHNRNDPGVVDGQVGKFRAGVQFVKTDDLKGFKRKRLK